MAKRGPKGPSKWTVERLNQLSDEITELVKSNHTIMLWEDVCAELDLNLQRLSEWEKSHDKFSETKKRMECIFTSRLFQAGGTGEFNPTMAIFGLKNSGTKWRDKTEQELTHNFPKAIEVTFRKASDSYKVEK